VVGSIDPNAHRSFIDACKKKEAVLMRAVEARRRLLDRIGDARVKHERELDQWLRAHVDPLAYHSAARDRSPVPPRGPRMFMPQDDGG
jgi:hypothetical protein